MVLKKTIFFVNGVTCNSCVKTVEKVLTSTPGIVSVEAGAIKNGRARFDLWIEDSINQSKLIEVINGIGFEFSEIHDESELESANLKHQSNIRRHWIFGGVGVLLGMIVLLLTAFAGPLPLAVMIGLGVVSVLVTAGLSAEFLWKAKNQIQRGEPAMDSLFVMSTGLVVCVSIAAFFVPWLPMMFDVGLLVFGFRHLGLALKETLFAATGIHKDLQSNAMEIVQKLHDDGQYKPVHVIQIQPGDIIKIQPDSGMIPVDGVYSGSEKNRPSLLKTHINGETSPSKLGKQEKILAGMILPAGSVDMLMTVSGEPAEVFSIMAAQPQVSDFQHDQHLLIYSMSDELHVAVSSGAQVHSSILTALSSAEKSIIQATLRPGELVSLPVDLNAKIIAHISGYNAQQKVSSHLSRIDQSIQNAERTKASIQKETEFFLQYYFIPLVLFIACLSAVLLSIFSSPEIAITCAISVLVSACPCTLGIITPLAMFVGMQKAQGITFQHADALEKASKISAVIFDLNGTLTEGKPEVINSDLNQDDLDVLFAMEVSSQHPIGQAIASYADSLKSHTVIECAAEFKPDGVQATIKASTYVIGNENMMRSHNVVLPAIEHKGANSLIYMAEINNSQTRYCGHIGLTDPVRANALLTVQALQQNGIEVHICTGADSATASSYARILGIKNICAKSSTLGEENSKEAYVKKIIANQNKRLLFVGDALNDAAALAVVRANGGVSMVVQHNHAVQRAAPGLLQYADVLLVGPISLLAVPRFLEVSQQAMSNIRWNLRANLAYNIIITLLCSGVLVSFGIVLHPAFGVAVMSAVFGLMLLSVLRFQRQSLTWVQNADSINLTGSTNQSKGHAPGMFDSMRLGNFNSDLTSTGVLLSN